MFQSNKIIVANWKMNPITEKEVDNLIDLYLERIIKDLTSTNNINFIIAPPAIYIKSILLKLKKFNINLGVQNISWESRGAFTGELSPYSISDMGVKYSIIGHSERRQYNQETEELIAKKFNIAIIANLIPIVCIGETKEEFEAKITKEILSKQLSLLDKSKNFLVAYEPRWAIGTGLSADLNYIANIMKYVKENLLLNNNIKLLYGGSVNAANIKDLFRINLDGVLIGGASLDVNQLTEIFQIIKQ